jgi:hypothetical protein
MSMVQRYKGPLTRAQALALYNFQQGRSSEVRSGPHLKALAARGYIERDACNCYQATRSGLNELEIYMHRACERCNGSGWEPLYSPQRAGDNTHE